MTKALAPHTPSIAASLIRPSRLKLKFVGAKKQKPAPPQGCPASSRGEGGGSLSRASFSATILASSLQSHHDSTFRRLGRNQAPRFVVVRLTKRVRRNHAFRETPLPCRSLKQRSPVTRKGFLHLFVEHHWGPNLRHQKVVLEESLAPKLGRSGGSTCSQPVKVCR
jgi:hypothetical protein